MAPLFSKLSSRPPRYYAPLAKATPAGVARVPATPRDVLLSNRARSLAADSLRHNLERSLYLDFERGDAGSPPSDDIMFDHMCYATTPSSSNGNSDMENPPSNSNHNVAPASPTSRLLLEYEMHLRNTLAKGMDAESCSLHTFEALLTQSMDNLGKITRHHSFVDHSFFSRFLFCLASSLHKQCTRHFGLCSLFCPLTVAPDKMWTRSILALDLVFHVFLFSSLLFFSLLTDSCVSSLSLVSSASLSNVSLFF